MKYTKIQEDRSKFNYMFGQLKECRLSLEKDDTPIVDIFNSIINVDLIKKSLTEKRTKFINKKTFRKTVATSANYLT